MLEVELSQPAPEALARIAVMAAGGGHDAVVHVAP